MDFFMELIMEIVIEGYFELMLLIVPKEKRGNKLIRGVITVFALAVALGSIALGIWGVFLISDGNNRGLIQLGVAIALVIAQIGLGLWVSCRK